MTRVFKNTFASRIENKELTVDNIIKGLFFGIIKYADLPKEARPLVDREMERRTNKTICPYCGKKQTQQPLKTWKYGGSVDVKRCKCSCGKLFNHYKSSKSEWTIPKKS